MIFGDEFEIEAENDETLVRYHVSAVASLVDKFIPVVVITPRQRHDLALGLLRCVDAREPTLFLN